MNLEQIIFEIFIEITYFSHIDGLYNETQCKMNYLYVKIVTFRELPLGTCLFFSMDISPDFLAGFILIFNRICNWNKIVNSVPKASCDFFIWCQIYWGKTIYQSINFSVSNSWYIIFQSQLHAFYYITFKTR